MSCRQIGTKRRVTTPLVRQSFVKIPCRQQEAALQWFQASRLKFWAIADMGQILADRFSSIGEVVIGFEVAKQEATERQHELRHELCLYVIHGCLHLCGYDDRSKQSAKMMRKKEKEYLGLLNLPDVADG